jgi:hypothetical protein
MEDAEESTTYTVTQDTDYEEQTILDSTCGGT